MTAVSGRRTWVSWSSGKDSALALHDARADPRLEVVGLMTTISGATDAVTMHEVPRTLVEAQAESLGLPLHVVEVPSPCHDDEYQRLMAEAVAVARAEGVTDVVFGDLHLANVRAYREAALAGTGLTARFPLWGQPVGEVAERILATGLRSVVTCVDTTMLDASFAGRDYDHQLVADLPDGVDRCGENGEIHTFVTDGPDFVQPVVVDVGPTRLDDGRFARVSLSPVGGGPHRG